MTFLRRLRPLLRRTLPFASLVLLALSIAGWVRSHRVADTITRADGRPKHEWRWGIAHFNGDLYFFRTDWEHAAALAFAYPMWRHDDSTVRYLLNRRVGPLGQYGWHTHQWQTKSDGSTLTVRIIGLPYWLLVLLFALPPAWWAIGWKRRRNARRRAAGCCTRCGYDLRGTPDRCPECGAIPRASR
jgi:hypothetical protein